MTRVLTWTCRIYGTGVLYGLRAWRVDNPPPLFPAFFIAGIDTTWTLSWQAFKPAYVIGTKPPRLISTSEGDSFAELLSDTVTVFAGRFAGCTSIRFEPQYKSRSFQETILKPGVGILRALYIYDTLDPRGYRESITLSEYTIVSGSR
ncbi:MAG: hypothetical protein IPP94_11155 [Ignavibacteria bacterium]|nr:hypothetical protein [Ignavibacteria bacterium]